MKLTIQTKLTALILPLVLIPLGVMGYLAYQSGQSALEKAISARFQEMAFHTMEEIDRYLHEATTDIRAWSAMSVMENIKTGDPEKKISQALKRLKANHGVYAEIFAIGLGGKIVGSSDSSMIGQDVSSEKWFRQVAQTKKLHYHDLKFSPLTGGFTINFLNPVRDVANEKETIGYLSAHFNWSELYDGTNTLKVNDEGQSPSGYVLLIDREGYVVSGPDFIFADEMGDERISEKNLLAQGYRSAKLALEGKNDVLVETDPTGRNMLIGYAGSSGFRDFEGFGWALLILEDTREAFAPVLKLRNQFVVLGAVVGLVAVILGITFSRGLSLPLRKLTRAAKQVARGDLSQSIDENSGDETGDLAEAFNHMTRDLKESRDKLISAKDYTENILKTMINSLVVTDRDYKIEMANEATLKLLGYEEKELIGSHIGKLFGSEKGLMNGTQLEKLPEKEFLNARETNFIGKDGHKIPILFSAAILKRENREIQGFIFVSQDITERKRAEKKLGKMQSQLVESEKLAGIGRLSASVCHEILNPVNIISLKIQMMLKNKELGPKLKDVLDSMRSEVERIVKIVGSLNKFSRKGSSSLESVQIKDELASSLALVEKDFALENIKIVRDFAETLPQVQIDKDEIRQVFLNLIQNAKYAMETGGQLAVSAKPADVQGSPFIRIEFADSGCGVAKENLDKIFEPFFTTKPEIYGTGLGLSICYQIIQKFNGTITAESELGKGAKFIIDLPVPTRTE